MCIGAGACSGAFLFPRNYFPGKRRMRQEVRRALVWDERNCSTTYGGMSYWSFYISNLKDLVA
jgi:hypothetical protein